MEDIPVKFEYEGIWFEGYLSKVSGAGNKGTYHLMIAGRYWGQLFYAENFGWRFASNSGMFEEKYMIEFFARAVEEAG